MDRLEIIGGSKLKGEIFVSGSKNSSLPLLFSSLLADGLHEFQNVPDLKDIESTGLLLKELNCDIHFKNNQFNVLTQECKNQVAPYEIVRKMRASILCLGPLIARYGNAKVSLPGGCAIGTRPIDLHLFALEKLGAQFEVKEGYVFATAKRLVGNKIIFPKITVGGTENVLMAAVLAEGETTIENAALEPEIVDLANYLIKMGAIITGAGTSKINITGVLKLNANQHTVIPDRIEAGTLLIAGAITGGHIKITNCISEHIMSLIKTLENCGYKLKYDKTSVEIFENDKCKPIEIETVEYPGFVTDLQAQLMTLLCRATGVSKIVENIFENRFMHVQELVRLGAEIKLEGKSAIITGKEELWGAPVMATDLRASASLVLAGLYAKGKTEVNRVYHLDRGYEKLEEKLQKLGANIKRI